MKVNELLFDGYNDALLSAAHSDLITTLSIALNEGKSIIPIPFPDMPNLALFYGVKTLTKIYSRNDSETEEKKTQKIGIPHELK